MAKTKKKSSKKGATKKTETTKPVESKNPLADAKAAVKETKLALTDYYKENKLSRKKDYADDKDHGNKISKLEMDVETANENLAKVKAEDKASKPAGNRKTKYEYPAEIDTPDKRKKYRQEQRAIANGGKKKASKKKVDKEAGDDDAKTAPKTKGKREAKKEVAKKEVTKKKVSKKKSKPAAKGGDDD